MANPIRAAIPGPDASPEVVAEWLWQNLGRRLKIMKPVLPAVMWAFDMPATFEELIP